MSDALPIAAYVLTGLAFYFLLFRLMGVPTSSDPPLDPMVWAFLLLWPAILLVAAASIAVVSWRAKP